MKKPLKICYIGWGHSIHTQRWMRWFTENGHKVYLITENPSNMNEITEYNLHHSEPYLGNKFKRYLKWEFNQPHLMYLGNKLKIDLIKKVLKVKNIVREIDPDIVHLHTLYYPSNLGIFIDEYPLVVTAWNGDIVWKYQWSFIRKYAVKRGLAKADLITVDSNELKQKALRYGNYSNKIELIYMGVDTRKFHPGNKSNNIRKQLSINTNAPIVISNRSLGRISNIDIIIRAIPLVLRVLPETIFLFTWHSGSEKEDLFDLAESLCIIDNIRFIGNVNHSELPELYAAADVAVSIPSADTTPVSLLEAMASGCAPVISDLPSPTEIIQDGINGYVVPIRNAEATAQAIIKILSDENTRQLFIKGNLDIVRERANYHKEMEKMESLYYGLIQKELQKSS